MIENTHSVLATRSVAFFREKFRKVIADSTPSLRARWRAFRSERICVDKLSVN